ncbi:hypothetical protein HPULCUR_003902 [Helicostylum pulchrum]|uniref:Homeodomain-like DNA binding domain-containing transcription factor n=1 Tax=Helicostylum pulchrum TaxID=562976 RepID=A0ABP9XVT0_9FUNG
MPLSNITGKSSRKRPELSDFTRGVICGLSQHAKWTNTDISKELDIPRTTIGSIVQKYVKQGQTSVKPRSGRPKVLNERDEHHSGILVQRESFEPLRTQQQNLASITGNCNEESA